MAASSEDTAKAELRARIEDLAWTAVDGKLTQVDVVKNERAEKAKLATRSKNFFLNDLKHKDYQFHVHVEGNIDTNEFAVVFVNIYHQGGSVVKGVLVTPEEAAILKQAVQPKVQAWLKKEHAAAEKKLKAHVPDAGAGGKIAEKIESDKGKKLVLFKDGEVYYLKEAGKDVPERFRMPVPDRDKVLTASVLRISQDEFDDLKAYLHTISAREQYLNLYDGVDMNDGGYGYSSAASYIDSPYNGYIGYGQSQYLPYGSGDYSNNFYPVDSIVLFAGLAAIVAIFACFVCFVLGCIANQVFVAYSTRNELADQSRQGWNEKV